MLGREYRGWWMGDCHSRTPGILIEFEIGVKGSLINVNQDPMRNALRIEKEEKRAVVLFTPHVTAHVNFPFLFFWGGISFSYVISNA